MNHQQFDIVIAGGGLAGSFLAGVMARAGLGVLLVEREAHFRDRVRGESTFPWGVADIERLELRDVFDRAGAVEIEGLRVLTGRVPDEPYRWAADSINGLPMLGFVHPRLQEAALGWAAGQGADIRRPAKVVRFIPGSTPEVIVVTDKGEERVRTRLVVGADGRNGASRRWTGGKSPQDPPNHRMGGVLVSGISWQENLVELSSKSDRVIYWFPVSTHQTRVFAAVQEPLLHEHDLERSFDGFTGFVAGEAGEGRFADARKEGPLAFFPNQCTWASEPAGVGIVLIGDAAGSLDPTQGHGTSQLFRDVRQLSELLISEREWQPAIEEYARRRWESFDVLRAFDRWMTLLRPAANPDAERLRDGYLRAIDADPALGGWRMLSARGPDGLVADEAARRHFFGEDL